MSTIELFLQKNFLSKIISLFLKSFPFSKSIVQVSTFTFFRYGSGLQDLLPYRDFKWLSEDQINARDFMKIDPDANRWFALEVDLEYPTELHNLHNDYPLAVEKRCVPLAKKKSGLFVLLSKTQSGLLVRTSAALVRVQ